MNYIHGHYRYFPSYNFGKSLRFSATFLHKFNIQTLADLNIWTVYITLRGTKSSSCCPLNLNPFSTNMDKRLEFSSGNWLLYLKSLFIGIVM